MTSQPTLPPAGKVVDYYTAIGPLLRMAWDDNFHFGYWDGPSDTRSIQEATDRFTDLLIARLKVGPGDRVLDVGCGIGKPALRLASATGAEVLGISITPPQVEQATERARAEGMSGTVTFRHADAMNMPFGTESFDAALAFESIMHMDRPTALKEIARVLKPGGRLVLTDVTPLTDANDFKSFASLAGEEPQPEKTSDFVASLVGIDDYPRLFADAGLRVDEVTDVTEHTKGTFTRLIYSIIDCRRDFERQYGLSVDEVLDAARLAQPNIPGVGCLIAAAHKP
ncbi:MAG TPA: methyltransferase domain-containing protein [Micromonosporaceae bacterium]|nr:methyltransferase domain-containing protein [Micromonosporaceae bacterium]